MSTLPLSAPEQRGRIHAHVAFFAYFFGLPFGILAARWLRTYTNRCTPLYNSPEIIVRSGLIFSWLLVHMIINGLLVGPLVIAAYVLGVQTTKMFGQPQFRDPHQVPYHFPPKEEWSP
jgi:hypothetical protein